MNKLIKSIDIITKVMLTLICVYALFNLEKMKDFSKGEVITLTAKHKQDLEERNLTVIEYKNRKYLVRVFD